MNFLRKSKRTHVLHARFRAGLRTGVSAALLTACTLQAQADERADALLQQVRNTLMQTQSLSAEFTTQSVYGSRYRDTQEKGTVALSRPGLARIQITRFRKPENSDAWKETGNGSLVVADGSRIWTLIRHPHSAQYRPTPATAATSGQLLDSLEPLRGFFGDAPLLAENATYLGSRQWENATYEVVRIEEATRQQRGPSAPQSQERRRPAPKTAAELYIGKDGFVHRYVTSLGSKGTGQREITLHHIQRNAVIPTTAFAFTPPSEAVAYERTPAGTLLTPGTDAPDFTIEDAAGKPLRLSDLRGKIVVLKFWATWCWSCKLSLPSTSDLARRYADKDVVVLAVDIWDSRKALQAWLSHRPSGDYLRFGIDPQPQGKDIASTLYHVKATPTQYVIDRQGKIVAALEGFDGPDDRLESAVQAAGATPFQGSAQTAQLLTPADARRSSH